MTTKQLLPVPPLVQPSHSNILLSLISLYFVTILLSHSLNDDNDVKRSLFACIQILLPYHESWNQLKKGLLSSDRFQFIHDKNQKKNYSFIAGGVQDDKNKVLDSSFESLQKRIQQTESFKSSLREECPLIMKRFEQFYQKMYIVSKTSNLSKVYLLKRSEGSGQKSRDVPLHLNAQIHLYDQRIGRTCMPEFSSGQKLRDDKEGRLQPLGSHYEDYSNSNEYDKEEPFPGMVMQISPEHSEIDPSKLSTQVISELETSSIIDGSILEVRGTSNDSILPLQKHQTLQPCKTIITMSGDGSNAVSEENLFMQVNEYQLLDVLHTKLGRIDHHNLDYAYRPVLNLLGSTSDIKDIFFWDKNGSEFDYARMGKRAFAGGSHGEVWRARKRCNQVDHYEEDKSNHGSSNHRFGKQQQSKQSSPYCDDNQELILKRMKIGETTSLMEAGLREVYFGDILGRSDESSTFFSKYVDHFFLHNSFGSTSTELWIVFQNAGASLRSHIYTPVASGDFVVYQHSPLWRKLRMEVASMEVASMDASNSVAVVSDYNNQKSNFVKVINAETLSDAHNNLQWERKGDKKRGARARALLKDFIYQILTSASKLHERGIIHRDIKPSNIMCRSANISSVSESVINCVIGDFSSAYDAFSFEHFYSKGPTSAEQTNEYAPPEVLFGNEWIPFFKEKPESYDSWSIGVVILEMMLGTPNVFSVDQRTTTLLSNKMRKVGASDDDIRRALYLAALSQYCIYVPTNKSDENWPLREGDPLFRASIVKTKCTIDDFHSALRARDPLGIGFDKTMDPLLQLVWDLLAWDPKNRLTASEAINHFYFTEKGVGNDDNEPNALEPQMLDPRLDTDIFKQEIDTFLCPKCGRKFADLNSCQAHATGRRHAKFCTYDRTTLPPCLNAHSMLPSHPTSGYCDIQGRRKVIEDFHTVHLDKDHQYFGIFDGHSGNLASKYAASELYQQFIKRLGNVDENVTKVGYNWKSEVENEMIESFKELHNGVLEAIKSYPTGAVMSKSGTTATVLYVTRHTVIVASVGDSRAVLSVGTGFDSNNNASSIQLTVDHVAADTNERKRIEELGGTISPRGGVLRVNGTLVLSRSIGDAHVAQYLSRIPNVVAMTKQEVKHKCGLSSDHRTDPNAMPCFIILASDGLWDVISNQEAIDLVEQVIQEYDSLYDRGWEENGGAFQEAAEVLTQEAYVRGSSDNIGVCVVAIT